MTRFTWRCDRCGQSGVQRIAARLGVWQGAQQLVAAHRRKAPTCPGGLDTVRLFTDESLAEVLAGEPEEPR